MKQGRIQCELSNRYQKTLRTGLAAVSLGKRGTTAAQTKEKQKTKLEKLTRPALKNQACRAVVTSQTPKKPERKRVSAGTGLVKNSTANKRCSGEP